MLRGGGHINNFTPQTTNLQIKTNSVLNSADKVVLTFLDETALSAGTLVLYFNSRVEFELQSCMSGKQAISNVPKTVDKIWTVQRSQDDIMIDCNDVKVVNFKLSSCSHQDRSVYGRQIAKVIFEETDTASDSYRTRGTTTMIFYWHRRMHFIKYNPIVYNLLRDASGR